MPGDPHAPLTLLARRLGEQADEAGARQLLLAEAVVRTGSAAAGFGRLAGGRLEFDWDGTPDVVAALARTFSHSEEALATAALAEDGPLISADLTADQRWPGYRDALLRYTPVRSVQAHRLRLADVDLGALVLYSTDVAETADGRPVAELAEHAAVGLSLLQNRARADHLSIALEHSREIGQAMGIIMVTHKVTSEAAFDLLRTVSQHGHVKLREVAREVSMTGQLPGGRAG